LARATPEPWAVPWPQVCRNRRPLWSRRWHLRRAPPQDLCGRVHCRGTRAVAVDPGRPGDQSSSIPSRPAQDMPRGSLVGGWLRTKTAGGPRVGQVSWLGRVSSSRLSWASGAVLWPSRAEPIAEAAQALMGEKRRHGRPAWPEGPLPARRDRPRLTGCRRANGRGDVAFSETPGERRAASGVAASLSAQGTLPGCPSSTPGPGRFRWQASLDRPPLLPARRAASSAGCDVVRSVRWCDSPDAAG
jgi:hypothetical protein